MATPQKKGKAQKNRKNPVRYFITGLSVVVLAGGAAVGIGLSRNTGTQAAMVPQTAIPQQIAGTQQLLDMQLAGRPMLGDPNAPVTIVEFADFQCPYCKQFETTVFPQLKQQYIDSGKAKFYFVSLAFLGPDSTVAAEIGYDVLAKAGSNGFFNYYQSVYAHQGTENSGWATPQHLAQIAAQAVPGFNAQKILAEYPSYASELNIDQSLAQQHQVTSTPTVLINGQKLSSWSYSSVSKAIDQALRSQ